MPVETRLKSRRRPNARPLPRRQGAFVGRLARSQQSTIDSDSGKAAPILKSSRVDEPLSIPPTSSSSSGESDSDPDYHVRERLESRVITTKESDAGLLESSNDVKTKSDPLDESLIIPSSALAEKARKILERELMFEKLIAQSKAELEALEEQMNELGTGYVAVSRSVKTRPPRKIVEIPDMVPSPIHDRPREARKAAIEELDEKFTRSLTSSGRPPLAPKSSNRLSDSKPLLTNVPLRSSSRKLV